MFHSTGLMEEGSKGGNACEVIDLVSPLEHSTLDSPLSPPAYKSIEEYVIAKRPASPSCLPTRASVSKKPKVGLSDSLSSRAPNLRYSKFLRDDVTMWWTSRI